MTSLLDHLDTRATTPPMASTTASHQLRSTMAAVRVSFTWMGTVR
jgi:hypothetical protein